MIPKEGQVVFILFFGKQRIQAKKYFSKRMPTGYILTIITRLTQNARKCAVFPHRRPENGFYTQGKKRAGAA